MMDNNETERVTITNESKLSDGDSCNTSSNDELAEAPSTPTTPGVSKNDDEIQDNNDTVQINNVSSTPAADAPSWSDALKTSSTEGFFSPARDIHKPGNFHGLALQLTAARSQKLSGCGQKCASLLFEISSYHETFATELLKSSQTLILADSPLNQSPVLGLAHATHKSLVSFARQVQGLAICIKGSVARPWKGYMTTVGELAPNIFKGYASARTKTFQARQSALAVRATYVNTIEEADATIQELRDVKKEGEGEDNKDPLSFTLLSHGSETGDWENSLKEVGILHNAVPLTERLATLVKQARSFESQYHDRVEADSQAVEYAKTMEIMALEALSKLEEERLQNFMETISRTLEAEKGALDKMTLSSLTEDSVDSKLKSPERKKKGLQQQDFFASLLIPRQSGQYEEGMGVMDAETLGLPQEVGKLRDEVRSRLEARSARLQTMRSLASILEDVAAATTALSTAISNRLGQDGYPVKGDSMQTVTLASEMLSNEGPNALQIWSDLTRSFEQEVETLSDLAKALRSTRHEKLDIFLIRADRDLKSASENDELMWKYLCDAARTETKAEQRYRQTAAMTVKARDRVKSVDSDSAASEQGTAPGNFKQSMSKALGNMFSVLPDGGDQAMQIFAPDARRAVAQSNLEEADQKEAKSRQYLQAANLNKSKALASYKAKAEGLVAAYIKDDDAGWADTKSALESVVVEFEKFRRARYAILEKQFTAVQETESEPIKQDMKSWADIVQQRVALRVEQSKQAIQETGDDMLSMRLDFKKSKALSDLMSCEARVKKSDSRVPSAKQQSFANESTINGLSDNTNSTNKLQEADAPVARAIVRSFTAPADVHAEEQDLPSQKLPSQDGGDGVASEDHKAHSGRYSPVNTPLSRNVNPESDVFLAHFWSDRAGNEPPPTVIESFSCAYWPKEGEGYLSPLLHGRLFATAEAMYFVGWGGKKIELRWKDVECVEKAKNLMGTIDNALRVSFETENGKGTYFFGSFSYRENAFTLMDRLSTVAKSLKEIEQPPKPAPSVPELPPVPPDEILKRMESVLTGKIENTSIKSFYDIVWSEGVRTEARPFYKPWLLRAAHDLHVGDWEFAEDGAPGFVNKWCGESYGQRRIVRFKFQRKTHLYIGPPIADVIQTHHCRVEGNDKVVLAMTVEFEGIPYADTFSVEVRWVARREGSNSIKVDVGVFVDFKKSTFLKKQISAGTISETKPVHQSLFEAAKRACSAANVVEGAEVPTIELETKDELEPNEVELPPEVDKPTSIAMFDKSTVLAFGAAIVGFLVLRWAIFLILKWSRPRLSASDVNRLYERIDDLETELTSIRSALDEVLTILRNRN